MRRHGEACLGRLCSVIYRLYFEGGERAGVGDDSLNLCLTYDDLIKQGYRIPCFELIVKNEWISKLNQKSFFSDKAQMQIT